MEPWKMRKSEEGDPEIGERFCVWKMEAKGMEWFIRVV